MTKNYLPKDIKKGLSDSSNFQKVCKIADKFEIKREGIEKLDVIFEKVLTGNLPPSKIVDEVKKNFGFSDELSQDIVKEMDREIFSNYKESLEKLYGKIEPQLSIKKDITKIEEKETPLPPLPPEPSLPKTPLSTIPSPEPSTEEKPPEKEDINNILERLEKELEEEKKERESLDKMLNNKDTTSKKIEKNNKEQKHFSDIYREKINNNEEEKPKIVKEENGKIKKVL